MRSKIFITGIPTAGKSYLAKRIIKETGGIYLETDNLRAKLARNPVYKKWTNFFKDQDEYEYLNNTDTEKHWNDLVKQSENLWPGILAEIRKYENEEIPLLPKIAAKLHKYKSENRPIVFEGVNILPHLAAKDLSFPGIVLIGKSLEEVRNRNRKNPRWGKTEELQRIEAESFWYIERPRYAEEAEKYGYKVFETADEAFLEIIKTL